MPSLAGEYQDRQTEGGDTAWHITKPPGERSEKTEAVRESPLPEGGGPL